MIDMLSGCAIVGMVVGLFALAYSIAKGVDRDG